MSHAFARVLAAGLVATLAAVPALAADPLPSAQMKAQDQAAGEPKVDPKAVAAVVNGEKITMQEVLDAKSRMPPQFEGVPFDKVYPLLVSGLVDSRLAAAEARRRGIHKRPDVAREIVRLQDQVIERIVLAETIASKMQAGALKARYDELVKSLQGKEEVRASHILLKTEEEAKAVIKELDGGADFAEVAKAKSTGPSAPKGGDLGYFGEGSMLPEFEQAAFALRKGEYSRAPVQTRFGFHVIKVFDRRPATVPQMGEVQQELTLDITRETAIEFVGELRKGAKVERYNLDGSVQTEAGPAAK